MQFVDKGSVWFDAIHFQLWDNGNAPTPGPAGFSPTPLPSTDIEGVRKLGLIIKHMKKNPT